MLDLTRKQKGLITKSFLVFAGGAYFVVFSQFNVNFMIRGYVMIIPLQILALSYVLYLTVKKKSDHKIRQIK